MRNDSETAARLVEAQARRIDELERRLAERTRSLDDATRLLAVEIRQREESQAALSKARRLEAVAHTVGGLAHDLRNALAIMVSGFNVLLRRSQDPAVRSVAEIGAQAAAQASSLIGSLLDFMRPRSPHTEALAVGDWLLRQEDLLRHAAGARIRCNIAADSGDWSVRVDPQRLGSAILNLLVNARQAMPEGGNLEVRAEPLGADAGRPPPVPAGEFVVLSVADTGTGMRPDVLARATEAMFTTKGELEGTGLGLCTVQEFVRASLGFMTIDSVEGAGTCVRLYLPRLVGESAIETAESPRRATESDDAAGDVLLVERDPLAREAIAERLRDIGCKVVECQSFEIAVAMLPALPHLVFAVVGGAADGAEIATLIERVRLERPGLPFLCLSEKKPVGLPTEGVAVLSTAFGDDTLTNAIRHTIASFRNVREPQASLIDRVIVRIRSSALLGVLLEWTKRKGDAYLPTFESLQGLAPELLDRTFIVVRTSSAAAHDRLTFANGTLQCIHFGRSLAEQLGRPGDFAGIRDEDAEVIGTLSSAYRRAANSGLPCYEFVRYDLGDGAPVRFERLILPATSDGGRATHLIGIILFSGAT